ncbi:hypothetical protein PMZ80_001313 [Knufia obscura]|uniref:Uncharacterized protein n=2 Tax=Knufia TaxID=430999 RepID=A0AAN8I7R0_9EURO|nr:hypothetical protein PMZ80_001313 [Knufia obscura]KAK5956284.1 hypothetical protein OHC33_002860 [Knufia fluminis]
MESTLSDDTTFSALNPHAVSEHPSSEDEATPLSSVLGNNGSRTSSHSSVGVLQTEHVIQLSSIEHCMPRAYIRICFAYRVPSEDHLEKAKANLRAFVKKTVDAKPYLAGEVMDVKVPGQQTGRAEIRFTTDGYLNYPVVEVQTLLNSDGTPIEYDELDEAGLPPSRLRPEEVSALPPNVDPQKSSPVLRVRANIVKGGLIVSFYLHHCISDGTGFDLLTSGDLLDDGYTFCAPPESSDLDVSALDDRLKCFAQRKTIIREKLSTAPADLQLTRQIKARHLDQPAMPTNPPGRGCVMMISASKVSALIDRFNGNDTLKSPLCHTTNSVLMALLWRHMTCARRPSIQHNQDVKTSTLLIPVNVRKRLREALPEGYFGAAVDSGRAELDLNALTDLTKMSLDRISHTIRQAVVDVDDSYVRQMIAFANSADTNTDVHDIQASNMDRVTGADMYITSWLTLRSYQHDLGMGIGGPDWVRKPWSRDPGSCIILPRRSPTPEYYEVVVQMTEADMGRLLDDKEFMDYVTRVID